MFRSLLTVVRELYLYLTKVIFMSKHSVKLRRYMYYVMWQLVVERHVCCVQCRMDSHSSYRRLDGPLDRSGWVRKNSPPPGFDARTVQPVACCYTD